MSDAGTRSPDDAAEVAEFLATVSLFDGVPEDELAELARALRRRELPAGELLWREGDPAGGLLLVVDGRVSVSLRLPGRRAVEVTSHGPGEMLGEMPLFDGGDQSTTAQVVEPASVLWLGRADFAALVSRSHPTAYALKRRIAGLAVERLRVQLGGLAASLGGEDTPGPPAHPPAELEFCGPPDSGFVRRLGAFRAFDSLALWGFLTAGRYALCAPGRTLIAEGATSTACFLTMHGAVEKILVRGGRRIRVGLAGPGQAFGYESLIDGGPAPMTAATRERALLLMLERPAFERLFGGETAGSHVFLDVINRELMMAQRQALRPQARLAASV